MWLAIDSNEKEICIRLTVTILRRMPRRECVNEWWNDLHRPNECNERFVFVLFNAIGHSLGKCVCVCVTRLRVYATLAPSECAMNLFSQSIKDINRFIDIESNGHYGLSNWERESKSWAQTNNKISIQRMNCARLSRFRFDFFDIFDSWMNRVIFVN